MLYHKLWQNTFFVQFFGTLESVKSADVSLTFRANHFAGASNSHSCIHSVQFSRRFLFLTFQYRLGKAFH